MNQPGKTAVTNGCLRFHLEASHLNELQIQTSIRDAGLSRLAGLSHLRDPPLGVPTSPAPKDWNT